MNCPYDNPYCENFTGGRGPETGECANCEDDRLVKDICAAVCDEDAGCVFEGETCRCTTHHKPLPVPVPVPA